MFYRLETNFRRLQIRIDHTWKRKHSHKMYTHIHIHRITTTVLFLFDSALCSSGTSIEFTELYSAILTFLHWIYWLETLYTCVLPVTIQNCTDLHHRILLTRNFECLRSSVAKTMQWCSFPNSHWRKTLHTCIIYERQKMYRFYSRYRRH